MAKKSKKQKANRSNVKYPGLSKTYNSKTRQDLLDQDYIDKLSDKEKEWLSNFNEEYISGNFNHKGKILNKTLKEKRECYGRNNARNRCQLTRAKAGGFLSYEGDLAPVSDKSLAGKQNNTEDVLNELIDLKGVRPKKSKKA